MASWLVRDLLGRGVRVRGTVRQLSRSKHLLALPNAPELLELVEADLLTPRAFEAAVAGCDYVFHTASPYVIAVKDPQRDLVDPAVIGTKNVLAACATVPNLRRVVLTSSIVAVTDEPPDRQLTEADWNTKSTLDRNPYHFSKALSERAAWDFIEQRKPDYDLVAINAFIMVGPSLGPGVNTSNQIFVDLLNGVFPFIIDLRWPMADVRDVARAHILAADTPGAHGRYLCGQDTVRMRDVVEWLVEAGYGQGTKLPRRGIDSAVGNWIVWLTSYFQPKGVGSYLRTNVGRRPQYDTSKIRAELGMQFRPVRATVLETMDDLRKWGHIEVPAARGQAV